MIRVGTVLPGIAAFRGYHVRFLAGDVAAGLAVAAVSVPMALAYAAMVGLPPETALRAAIVGLAAYALFGPSPRLVVGPDTALCAVLADVLGRLAVTEPAGRGETAAALALGTGAVLLAAGASGVGRAAVLLARPVLVGFVAGVGLTLIGSQLGRLVGLDGPGSGLVGPVFSLLGRLSDVRLPALALGLASLLAMLAWSRLVPRVPAAPVVLALALGLAAVLDLPGLGVAVLGPVPSAVPMLALPRADVPAEPFGEGVVALAVIAFASGVIPARAFNARAGLLTDPNAELRGLGLANLAAGLTGGFAVTGTSSRTAVAFALGARSPLAALTASLALGLAASRLGPLLAPLPVAVLAAILIATGAGLIDPRAFRRLWDIDRREFWIALITALGVVAVDALKTVALGVLLSLANYLRMASRPRDARLGRIPGRPGLWKLHLHPEAKPIPGILVWQFQGSPVFVAADRLGERLPRAIAKAEAGTRFLVLDCSAMTVLDSTGAEVLERAVAAAEAAGLTVVLGGGHARFRNRLKRSPSLAALPWFDSAEAAVEAIERGEIAPLARDAATREG